MSKRTTHQHNGRALRRLLDAHAALDAALLVNHNDHDGANMPATTVSPIEALRALIHALDIADDVADGLEQSVDAHTAAVSVGQARNLARAALAAHDGADASRERPHQGGIEVVEIDAQPGGAEAFAWRRGASFARRRLSLIHGDGQTVSQSINPPPADTGPILA